MIRQAAITKGAPRTKRSETKTIAAPIKGWNARDPIASMDEEYAVILDNWVPQASKISLRRGRADWKTGISGQVSSLMPYNGISVKALFAANETSFYNVTTSGAVGAAVVTGNTNGYWQSINTVNSAGDTFLIAVNGIDLLQRYNGTTWFDGTAAPAITGIDTKNLININTFARRVFFVEKNSMSMWYLPVDSIGGALVELPLGANFKKGGYLMAMGTWTLDAGEGMDDHAVFITSEGEVAVYKGTDPSSASTWAKVGVFEIAPPIGRRCFKKFGGELLIICKDGVQALSKALISTSRKDLSAITDNIQEAMTTSALTYGNDRGWDLTIYPSANLLILNIPSGIGSQQQYVMNTLTKAWCRFTGWYANCFCEFNEEIYFGGAGVVSKAYQGFSDAGAFITGSALPAFTQLSRSNKKTVTMVKPIIDTNSTGILLSLKTEFDLTPPIGTPTFSTTTSGVWGTFVWGIGVWGGSTQLKDDWQGVSGTGVFVSLYLKATSNSSRCDWISTDYLFQVGGVL